MDTNAIEMALAAGLDTVKFFPAEQAGGVKMMKALSGPYVNLHFMPTGGINRENRVLIWLLTRLLPVVVLGW